MEQTSRQNGELYTDVVSEDQQEMEGMLDIYVRRSIMGKTVMTYLYGLRHLYAIMNEEEETTFPW